MNKHIYTLEFLRGVAALGVVALHFTLTIFFVQEPNALTTIFGYGKYGVQVFFVISGFIIPYSMWKSNYYLGNYFNYLKRRFTRIALPSYLAILLTFGLYYAAIIILGRPINNFNWPGTDLLAVFGNLTYTVPYLETNWYNPVYWTLAIEFQFYILIGLIFPLILKKNNLITTAILIACMIVGLWVPLETFFSYSCFFVFGLCIFLKRSNLLSKYFNLFLFAIAIISCITQHNYPALIFSLVAFIIIFSEIKIDTKATNFIGKISFSIYITHCVVEILSEVFINRFINIELTLINRIILLVVHLGITILFASVFYKFIEKPLAELSKRMKKTTPKL